MVTFLPWSVQYRLILTVSHINHIFVPSIIAPTFVPSAIWCLPFAPNSSPKHSMALFVDIVDLLSTLLYLSFSLNGDFNCKNLQVRYTYARRAELEYRKISNNITIISQTNLECFTYLLTMISKLLMFHNFFLYLISKWNLVITKLG